MFFAAAVRSFKRPVAQATKQGVWRRAAERIVEAAIRSLILAVGVVHLSKHQEPRGPGTPMPPEDWSQLDLLEQAQRTGVSVKDTAHGWEATPRRLFFDFDTLAEE